MKVWMIIWSYWPGPQGGAERQCRMIIPHLAQKKVFCKVLTARLSRNVQGCEHDGATPVHRLGVAIPLLLRLEAVTDTLISGLLSSRLVCNLFRLTQIQSESLQSKVSFWCSLPWVWLQRLFFMISLYWFWRRNSSKVDVVHVHETGWLGAFSGFLGKKFNIPVICKEATYPPFPKIGWDTPFPRFLRKYQRNSWIIALNEVAKKDMVKRGVEEKYIMLIPNAVDMPVSTAAPENSRIVLGVGNFNQGAHQKGFDVLIKAWSLVSKRTQNAKLVMVGGGSYGFWQKLAATLGCAHSVEFPGFSDDPSKWYLAAGIFVLPSRHEGMSNALLEALSFGLPVVASDIPGNSAVVQDHATGRMFPVDDAHELSHILVDLLDNPQLRKQLGKNGRAFASINYDTDSVSSRLITAYSNMIEIAGCQ